MLLTKTEIDIISNNKCREYTCGKLGCKIKSSFHPIYIENGLAGCYNCDSLENIIKNILCFRGYQFIKIFKDCNLKVEFKCDKSHICIVSYGDFRKGRGCKFCKKIKKTREKNEEPEIYSCLCKELKKGKKNGKSGRVICEHYNFAILYPDLIKEWDYVLNEELPNEIAPKTNKKYWFKCEKYGVSYLQEIKSKTRNMFGCPFCNNFKCCKQNSLLYTNPEICSEWDFDENFLYPDEILKGSNKEVWWICRKTEEIHRYKRSPSDKTRYRNIGCKCNSKGYEQKIGGHDFFVNKSNEVHNNKYSYPDKYIDSQTKINIYCPVKHKNGSEEHGNFFQKPSSHKSGSGCPKCYHEQTESRGITMLKKILNSLGYEENINYFIEKKLEGLKHINSLCIDIYLELENKINIAIEWDGEQHFKKRTKWGGEKRLEENKKRDKIKDLYCVKNGISLIRFPYNSKVTIEDLKNIIESCKIKQIYKSYPENQEFVREKINLDKINVIKTIL